MTRRRLQTRKVDFVIFRKVRTNLVDEIHYPGIRLKLVRNRIYNLQDLQPTYHSTECLRS